MTDPSLSAAPTAKDDASSGASAPTGYSPLTGFDKETPPATPATSIARRGRKRSLVKAAAREAWQDLRETKWGRSGLWFLYICWLALIVFALTYLCTMSTVSFNPQSGACQPDGSFSAVGEGFDWWRSSSFFQISLSAGELSFADVKVLDIATQLVVGRGGQALLAFISWRAFRNFFTVRMTEDPVTFATFFIVFLQPEPTMMSTYRLIREFSLHRRPGSIATAIFIPLTVIFTLIFPTAVNSMSGYMTVNKPYVEARDGKILPFTDMDVVAYVIHDGKRINETDDFIVPSYKYNPKLTPSYWADFECSSGSPEGEPEGCDILRAASSYAEDYGFFGLKDEETTWMGEVKLEAPALNISGFYYGPDSPLYGAEWKDPRDSAGQPFTIKDNSQWVAGDEMYDVPYMRENGKCQPASETYKYGVSFAQLVIMAVALFVWSVGTSILWFAGHRRLPLVDQPEVPSGWRAVIDLSRAMEAEFRAAGVDVAASTDAQVKREVRKGMRGGCVSFREHRCSRRDGRLGPAVWAWLKRERWWLPWSVPAIVAGFGVLFGFTYAGSRDLGAVLASVLWSIGWSTTFALWLGTTLRSRLFMLSVLLLGVGLPMCILVGVKLDPGP